MATEANYISNKLRTRRLLPGHVKTPESS